MLRAISGSWASAAAAAATCAFAEMSRRAYAKGSPKIGIIGLGQIGWQMGVRLLKQGYAITVHDLNASAVESFSRMGAASAPSPAALAATPGLEAIISVLPTTENVLEVYTGDDGILRAPGGVQTPLLIDCTTMSPLQAKMLASLAGSAQLHPACLDHPGLPRGGSHGPGPWMVDAPVSGGVMGARNGTLTIMCGGDTMAVSAASRYLGHLGSRIVQCGPAGSGQAAKVCNNLVLGATMAALAEALALGRHLGIEPHRLSDVLNTSSGRCWASEVYNPAPGVLSCVPAAHSYQPGFATSQIIKDLRLAMDSAEACGSPCPVAGNTLSVYLQSLQDAGGADLDFSSVFATLYRSGLPSVEEAEAELDAVSEGDDMADCVPDVTQNAYHWAP